LILWAEFISTFFFRSLCRKHRCALFSLSLLFLCSYSPSFHPTFELTTIGPLLFCPLRQPSLFCPSSPPKVFSYPLPPRSRRQLFVSFRCKIHLPPFGVFRAPAAPHLSVRNTIYQSLRFSSRPFCPSPWLQFSFVFEWLLPHPPAVVRHLLPFSSSRLGSPGSSLMPRASVAFPSVLKRKRCAFFFACFTHLFSPGAQHIL